MKKIKKIQFATRVKELPANAEQVKTANEIDFKQIINNYAEKHGIEIDDTQKLMMADKLRFFVNRKRFNCAVISFWME